MKKQDTINIAPKGDKPIVYFVTRQFIASGWYHQPSLRLQQIFS